MKKSISIFTIFLFIIFGSCTQQVSETVAENYTERNKASILKANEELLNKGNVAFADEVFTNDYANEGPEWIKAYITELRTAFPDLKVTIDPIIAENNMVAWKRTHTGTHQGEYMGFQPTGKKLTWHTMIFSDYNEEGKVAEEWAVSDLYEVLHKNKIDQVAVEE